ncbi:hypothetical protein GQR36_14865 [Enterococcus termitis]
MQETVVIDLLQQTPTHTLSLDQLISTMCGKSEIEVTNKDRIVFASKLKYMSSIQKNTKMI